MNDRATGGPAGTRAVDFVQTPPDGVQITWKGNCFDAEGGGQEGRVWFDRQTFDVIRIDARLSKPFLVPVPSGLFGIQPTIRVERSEVLIRFSRVKFEKPDEIVLLPESIETLTVFRGVPSLRTVTKVEQFPPVPRRIHAPHSRPVGTAFCRLIRSWLGLCFTSRRQ